MMFSRASVGENRAARTSDMRAAALVSLTLLLASLVAGCQSAAMQRVQAGKALYEEKCRTVAGERIYRTVEDVEGVLLMKVRSLGGAEGWANPNWPGAAFAGESYDDEYITTFLAFKYPPSVPFKGDQNLHSQLNVTPGPGSVPGYRYVEVMDMRDGKRYRYTFVKKARPTSRIGWVDTILDKAPTSAAPPRYGVTFEDHVIPEERALWVASSTVKVIDLETNEVLGEMLRYAWAGGGPSPASPSPWLRAWQCPGQPVATNAATRKFVDRILIPKREEQ